VTRRGGDKETAGRDKVVTNRQDETQATGTSLSEPKRGWSYFAKWVLATIAGFGVGAGLTGFVGDRVASASG